MSRIKADQHYLLPNDPQAEKAVLGSLLIDPDALYRVQESGLTVGDFLGPANQILYAGMIQLAKELRPIEIIGLANVLGQRQSKEGKTLLDQIGGIPAINALAAELPSAIYVSHYAEIVIAKARQRRLMSVAGEIVALANDGNGSTDGLYDHAMRLILGATETASFGSHLYGGDDALESYIALQTGRRERLQRDPDSMIVTGLHDLDRLIGDIAPGILHAVVARPAVGKTAYMETVAENNARRGHRVAFYHLELSHDMMSDRMMARYAGIPVNELRRGAYDRRITDSLEGIRQWYERIIYIHCPGWSCERITADIRRLVARDECELAIVDYLQKIALPSNRNSMNAAMLYGLIAEGLKNCAELSGIPIIMGAQVSRQFKTQKDKRPHMEDIRNSGEIEEKANQIVVLHRPSAEDQQFDFGSPIPTECHVEKNTQGATGSVDLLHIAGRFLIAEPERQS